MGTPWKLDTHEKLLAAGYQFLEDAPCKSEKCGKTVKWYLTPKGHNMPFSTLADDREPGEEDHLQPHFVDCKEAAKFTSRGSKAGAA